MTYYDRQGNKVTMEEWATMFSLKQDAMRRVAETQVGNLWVSTVFLGLDHNWGGGKPLIFETMVFDRSENDASDLDCRRYSTEAEALSGHAEVVEEIVSGRFTGYNDDPIDPTHVIDEEQTLV